MDKIEKNGLYISCVAGVFFYFLFFLLFFFLNPF
jgi:hypothetical protein